ncbi:hypothetical protein ES5_17568 [Dietzia cinnamea P4]|nr:hypothetical protein ES5_17568 [Dietzia cinnamea P4]
MRYVVIELKTGKFKPEHAGQLQFYVALVEALACAAPRMPRLSGSWSAAAAMIVSSATH